MKVFHPVCGGLGDVLGENFCPSTRNQPRHGPALTRMIWQWRRRMIDEAAVVYRSGDYNRSLHQLFAGVGLRTLIASPDLLPNGLPHVSGLDLSDWTDSRSLVEPADAGMTPVPTVQPHFTVPRRYILLNESASEPSRRINDPAIYHAIKSACPSIPIVKVGAYCGDVLPCDQNLTDRTNLRELAWLAKNAACIVSAVTFHRCWSSIYGVPVLELSEEGRATDKNLKEAAIDYGQRRYGITPEKNKWFLWPRDSQVFKSTLIAETLTRGSV